MYILLHLYIQFDEHIIYNSNGLDLLKQMVCININLLASKSESIGDPGFRAKSLDFLLRQNKAGLLGHLL